ncbi:MAG: hypothetical protein ABSH34_26030 [Verrucomicrobiota bacterium]
MEPAWGPGRQAVALGLETLDVATIHEQALATLEASGSKNGTIERADLFFTEAIAPIEKTHRAALEASARLSRLNQTEPPPTGEIPYGNPLTSHRISSRLP